MVTITTVSHCAKSSEQVGAVMIPHFGIFTLVKNPRT